MPILTVTSGQTMKVVVIGGTGLVGAKLVARLRDHGHDAIAASPAVGIDAFTGVGLAEAMRGARAVVDVSNARTGDAAGVLDFFSTSTRNLIAAEASTGVRHHIALSIVGTERHQDSPYYRAKSAQERLIQSGPIPYTIIHATQFFEFLPRVADRATTGNVVRVSSALVQPMAADDVASILERVALGAPINSVIEIAGPEPFRLDDAIRRTLAARNDPREVIGDPATPYAGAPLDERTLLPGPRAELASTRLEDWLRQSGSGR
jgi:uncharacterized protein YbjT (DUF2867 family)